MLQAQLREWEADEAQKKALAREIALKLKDDRAAQLADRDLVRTGCNQRVGHGAAQHMTAPPSAQPLCSRQQV
jgi:hypothetical protein